MIIMPEEGEAEEGERELSDEEREEREEMQGMSDLEQMSEAMRPPLLSRMSGMQRGPQNKIMVDTLRKLRGDIDEMKDYLKKILETLEAREK